MKRVCKHVGVVLIRCFFAFQPRATFQAADPVAPLPELRVPETIAGPPQRLEPEADPASSLLNQRPRDPRALA